MDLPRIASHTSLSVPQLELLNYNRNVNCADVDSNNPNQATTHSKNRQLASKRLLSVAPPTATPGPSEYTTSIPQIAIIPPGASTLVPSRRREEALVLKNLRKRVQQLKVVKANQQLDNEPISTSSVTTHSYHLKDVPQEELDNRPHLLQRILIQRPVSMVLDAEELQTAWQDSDFITDCLCWHNVYRQRHNAQPLTMSPELCDYAQTWANHLAHTNTFYYRNDRDVGQNLFCRPANSLQTDVTGQEVSSYWYSAVRQYDFGKEPDVLHANVNAGHFTQLVWASSRLFGIGKARSRSGKVLVVANYLPPGNISGAFEENVLPPQPEPGTTAGGNIMLHVPQLFDITTPCSDTETESSSSMSSGMR